MLRKVRMEAPAERLAELKEAAKHSGIIFDWAIVDADPGARWPYAGNGKGTILVYLDDEDTSAQEALERIRNAHRALTRDGDSSFIELGGSYVFWPDGCSIETYRLLDGPTVLLHEAEARAARPDATAQDLAEVQRLREALRLPLAQAFEFGEAAVEDFLADMGELGFDVRED